MPEPIRPQPTTPTLSITFVTFRRPMFLTCGDLARPLAARSLVARPDAAQFRVTEISVAFTAAHSSRPTLISHCLGSADGDLGGQLDRDLRDARAHDRHDGRRRPPMPATCCAGCPSGRIACSDTACGRITAIAGPSTSAAATTRVAPPSTANTPAHHRTGQQVHADELGHVRRPRMGGDLGERPVLHDMAILDDHHSISQRVGVDRIVRHQHGRSLEARRDGDAARGAPRPGSRHRAQPTVRRAAGASARRQALGRARPAAPDRRTAGRDATVRCPRCPPCEARAGLLDARTTCRRRVPAARTQRSRAPTCAERAGTAETSRRTTVARTARTRRTTDRRSISPSTLIDPRSIANKPGEATKDGRLARTVGTEQGDDLAGLGVRATRRGSANHGRPRCGPRNVTSLLLPHPTICRAARREQRRRRRPSTARSRLPAAGRCRGRGTPTAAASASCRESCRRT